MGTRMTLRRWTAGGAAVMVAVALSATAARACMDYRPRPAGLVARAVSEDPAEAHAAVEKLRAMGPQGLGVLMYVYEVIGPAGGFGRGTYPAFGPEALRVACAEENEG